MDKILAKFVHKGRKYPLQLRCSNCLTAMHMRGQKREHFAADAAKAGWGAHQNGDIWIVLCPVHFAAYLQGRDTDESRIRNSKPVDDEVSRKAGETEISDGDKAQTPERRVEKNGEEIEAKIESEKSGTPEPGVSSAPEREEGDAPESH